MRRWYYIFLSCSCGHVLYPGTFLNRSRRQKEIDTYPLPRERYTCSVIHYGQRYTSVRCLTHPRSLSTSFSFLCVTRFYGLVKPPEESTYHRIRGPSGRWRYSRKRHLDLFIISFNFLTRYDIIPTPSLTTQLTITQHFSPLRPDPPVSIPHVLKRSYGMARI